MTQTTQEPSQQRRIPSSLLIIMIIALGLSLVALVFATEAFIENDIANAGWFLATGFVGIILSFYFLMQIRGRAAKLRIVIPPVTTTIECRKCGFKSVREFQRGDYVFKDLGQCEKCAEKMLITAIYREVKED